MESSQYELLSRKARLAAVVVGVVASFATLSAVLLAFASLSGEVDPLLAKRAPAPAASAVVGKELPKPKPG